MSEKPVVKEEPKLYSDEINSKTASEILGLTEMRTKTLAREGKLPCKKNDKGWWKFSRAEIEALAAYRAENPSSRGGRKDGRKKYFLYLTDEEHALVSKSLKSSGIEILAASKSKKASAKTEPQPTGPAKASEPKK